MCAYVLQSWTASNDAVAESKAYVAIHGRGVGVGSWLLGLLGITPVASLVINAEEIKLATNNLRGDRRRILPLENVTSTLHGITRPWQAAAGILALAVLVGNSLLLRVGPLVGAGVIALGVVVAALYIVRSPMLTIAFVGTGGERLDFHFHAGSVGGNEINGVHAAYVAELTQGLMENRKTALTATHAQAPVFP